MNQSIKKVEEGDKKVVAPYWDFSNKEFTCIPPPNAMVLHLSSYECVRKFKSVRRAIRKGHIDTTGLIYPKRPFHNKKNTSKHGDSRAMNTRKKLIYEQLKVKSA